MIWLTWRQYRTQLLVGLGAVGLLAAYLLHLGLTIGAAYDRDVAGCLVSDGCDRGVAEALLVQSFQTEVLLCSLALCALPLLIGLFFGAPLVAQEYELGTHQLVWTQSVSRTRWLALKLAVTLLLTVAAAGLLSLLLTWAASRYDQVLGNRFDPISFASRNVAPLGYAVLALVVGVLAGLVLRRVVAAMALTLALLGLAGTLLPMVVRPHLQTPVTQEVPFGADFRGRADGLAMQRDATAPVIVIGYFLPGALMLDEVTPLRTADGEELLSGDASECAGKAGPMGGADGPDAFEQCLIDLDLHLELLHQPADRYWRFQWLEVGWLLAVSALLAGASWWRIRR